MPGVITARTADVHVIRFSAIELVALKKIGVIQAQIPIASCRQFVGGQVGGHQGQTAYDVPAHQGIGSAAYQVLMIRRFHGIVGRRVQASLQVVRL